MLFLIRGLPGSGKSTLAKAMLGTVADEHWEADMFFMEGDKYTFAPHLLPAAHSWCQFRTLDSLKKGKRVVVANTFVQLWELQPYFYMVKELQLPCVLIEAKGSWKSLHDVPEETIASMKRRWQGVAPSTNIPL